MAHFAGLPVLHDIAAALCGHCSPSTPEECVRGPYSQRNGSDEQIGRAALAALTRTCRTLNDVATPVLYHSPKPSIALIRSMARRPQLARYVRRLFFDLSDSIMPMDSLDDEDVTLLEDLAAAHAVPNLSPNWLRVHPHNEQGSLAPYPPGFDAGPGGILDEDPDSGIVGLLIAMCPNLEDLSVGTSYGTTFPFSKPGTLQRLKRLTISHLDTELGSNMEVARELLAAAPKIEVFGGWQLSGTRWYREDGEPQLGPVTLLISNLRELSFRHSSFSRSDLRHVLRGCPQLERFIYEAGGATVGDEQFTPRDAQNALVRFVPGLKYLELDFQNGEMDLLQDMMGAGDDEDDDDDDDDDAADGDGLAITTLKGLRSLEVLELDTGCITSGLGSEDDEEQTADSGKLLDLLPQSIQQLRLNVHYDQTLLQWEGLYPLVIRLASEVPHQFPGLTTVTVRTPKNVDGAEAKALFEANGVEFELAKYA